MANAAGLVALVRIAPKTRPQPTNHARWFNVTDAAWAKFVSDTITPNFPDGLTVFDGYGQSRNPATGQARCARWPKIVS